MMARDKKSKGVETSRPTKEEYHDELRGARGEPVEVTSSKYAVDDARGDVEVTFRDAVEIRTGVTPPYTRVDLDAVLLTNALGVMGDGPLRDRLERKLADLLAPEGDDTTTTQPWGQDVS